MMTTLSILLIENDISNATFIVENLSEYLYGHKLIVTRSLDEAYAKSLDPRIMLLNMGHLQQDDLTKKLAAIKVIYPQCTIILLIPPVLSQDEQEVLLLEALAVGVADYVPLSKIGLLSLGRRLATLNERMPSTEQFIFSIINNKDSSLAIQGIGPDNKIHTWNQQAEQFFGLKANEIVGQSVDALPLSGHDLMRLKDILDQAYANHQPFCILDYPLASRSEVQRWIRAYVYPIADRQQQGLKDIYILSTDVTDLKQAEVESRRYNQELQVLLEISQQVSGQATLEMTLEIVADQTKSLLNADQCLVYQLEMQNRIRPLFSLGPNPQYFQKIVQQYKEFDNQTLLNSGKGFRINYARSQMNNSEVDTKNLRPDLNNVHLLYAPLKISQKPLSILVVRNGGKTPFSEEDLRFFENLIQHAAVAIDNVRLFEETQQSLQELSVLYEASQIVSTNWNTQEVLEQLIQQMAQTIEATHGYIVSWDKDRKLGIVQASVAQTSDTSVTILPELTTEINLQGQTALVTALLQQRTMLFELTNPTLDQTERENMEKRGYTTRLFLPLVVKGEAIGWAELLGQQPEQRFTIDQIRLTRLLSNQAAVALSNVQYLLQLQQTYEAELRRRQQAETLREISFVVGSSLNPNKVLDHILDQLQRVIAYDSAAVHLVEGKQRRIIAGHGFPEPDKIIGLTFPASLDRSEPGSIVMHEQEPLAIEDLSSRQDMFQDAPHKRIRSWMGVPLVARDKTIGLITIDRETITPFSRDEIDLAHAFANQVAVALENARLYDFEISEIERELETAHEIQETLLPQFAPQIPGLQIAGRTTPVRQIGGDFFYFFTPEQDQFGVAVGDVSGKGIPAALYMAAVMTAIDAEINHNHPKPGQLLENLHHILYQRLQQNRMNIGLQVATFAPKQVQNGNTAASEAGCLMTVASAGMIAPILATEQGCQFLEVGGLPLGSPVNDPQHEDHEILLTPGTAIIFTSDGIVEAQNEHNELFGFERLETAVNDIIHRQDAELIAEHIIYTAQAFTKEGEAQHDDMTVVVVLVTAG